MLLASLLLACSEPSPSSGTSPEETDADADADSDTDTDSDTDADHPGLEDLWEGRARFELDTATGPYGADYGFQFPSTVWDGDTLWAYYVSDFELEGWSHGSETALATSTDGISFVDKGVVLAAGGAEATYGPEDTMHAVGEAEEGGWSANTEAHEAGYLSYGPYVDTLPAGLLTVRFQLMVDDNTADDLPVVSLDVFDVSTQTILAQREVTRSEFDATWTYQGHELQYRQQGGHNMEFRVHWHDVSYVRLGEIVVGAGRAPFHDTRLASFPGVWKEGEDWTMVYEAADAEGDWSGDISLASSDDGWIWTKDEDNPILQNSSEGWDSVRIGRPSLWFEDGTWTLLYEGYDGEDVQIGIAQGPSLKELEREASNPVLQTAPGAWDSGSVGARDLRKEGAWYYMAYEGSTDGPFDTASWSTGLARSTDLVGWERYEDNPLLPETGEGFGYDGPELIETPDGALHLYYRDEGNTTKRATLVWE